MDGSGERPLPLGWRKAVAAGDIVAKLAIPLVLVIVGCYVNRSIARIEAAPDLLELALETIDQDPRSQPAGLRSWAVDLLDEYSSAEMSDDLKARLRAGWPLTVPFQPVGSVAFEHPESSPNTLDGHTFELSFAEPEGPDQVLRKVELSLPARGHTVTAESLETTNILQIHVGPRAYLFRFEVLESREDDGLVAWFSVWRQSPGFLGAPETEEPDRSRPEPTIPEPDLEPESEAAPAPTS